MRADARELYMRCYRPESSQDRDPLFAKAMKEAMADERLRPLADDQTSFDQWAIERVSEIEIPEETLGELARAYTARPAGLSWRSPAVLSVILGLILIAGVFGYFWIEEMAAFDGRGAVEKMVERTSKMTEKDLQPVAMKLGDLDDWLFMQGVDSLQVPPNFQNLTAVGARVFQQGGYPVVQLALEEQDMLVFLFHSGDFGVRLKKGDAWKIFPVDDWVAAVRLTDTNVIMLAMRGNRADMQNALAELDLPY